MSRDRAWWPSRFGPEDQHGMLNLVTDAKRRSALAGDPRDPALDVDCRAHDVDNLYVVDTSFFPSSSAVNPALTAMANPMRVGDHLMARLGISSEAAAPQPVGSGAPR